MNKTAVKNFAVWARKKLIEDVKNKAVALGITKDGIAKALPQFGRDIEFYDIGLAEPCKITGNAISQRRSLVDAINAKAAGSDYQTAYNFIMEEVAYTWFNRLIAIRFMEVNDYLPGRIRVLSAEGNKDKVEPDIAAAPFDAGLQFSDAEAQQIAQLKNENKLDELFRLLFIKQCNALNKILPFLFEKTSDYTELLLNLSVTDNDGVVRRLINDIPEEDFDIEQGGQVEIIGWLYQYYNTELKNETFALLKKNVKITKERIPSATQLFTPHWIVRYMVENSLGRLWLEGHPDNALKQNWQYYLDEAEQEADGQKQLDEIKKDYAKLNPQDIKFIDPCMGSGHILVYAFDVLMQIYENAGFTARDAAQSILEHNLYGLDIDERAFQLAYFALMMKARQYNRRIFTSGITPHVYAIKESNGFNRAHLQYFGAGLSDLEFNIAINEANGLLDDLKDASEYGSIINVNNYNWQLLRQFANNIKLQGQIGLYDMDGFDAAQGKLLNLIAIGEVLAQKYNVVVTNPPYMGSNGMNAKLAEYVKRNYADEKNDLFSVFVKQCTFMSKVNGFYAMITQPSILFLSSFEQLRKKLVTRQTIQSLLHMGRGIFGIDFGSTSFIIRKSTLPLYKGEYFRLHERTFQYIDPDDIKEIYLKAVKNPQYTFNFSNYTTDIVRKNDNIVSSSEKELKIRFSSYQANFSKIPGSPIAYWVSDNYIAIYNNPMIKDFSIVTNGLFTCDNKRFLRLWYEIKNNNIFFNCDSQRKCLDSLKKWYPYNKGGDFRRWYGNQAFIVNFKNFGKEISEYRIRNNQSASFPGQDYYFKKSISWSLISSSNFGVRSYPDGFVFDIAGSSLFPLEEKYYNYILAFLASKIATYCLETTNPTLNFQAGNIKNLPLLIDSKLIDKINVIIDFNILNSKSDWDSFETSWDFKEHPLVKWARGLWDATSIAATMDYYYGCHPKVSCPLELCFMLWQGECNKRFTQLKANEEELNRIFIDIYGLQDELTPDVADKDVTVARIYNNKEDIPESMKGNNYVLTKQDVVKSLISYAVGCMFGRYSLDAEGIAYAGGEWDADKYQTFTPDEDNCILIIDEAYAKDDIAELFGAWLKKVYGTEQYEENLKFIADALGNKGSSSHEVIRNYFLTDFIKDHIKTYKKRPIYWLFDSGKQNGFKALIYLHRYNADTIGNLRVDYLHKMQRIYESEMERLQYTIENGTNAREVAAATKRKEKLQKQLKECRDYDEKISHLALARIELDLDDGVKVNYEKVQTAADGKKYQVLAKI